MEKSVDRTNNGSAKIIIARFIIYTLAIFGLTSSLPAIISYGDVVVFSENGPIEWLQFTLILSASAVFFVSSRCRERRLRELFIVLSLLAAFASIRELDSILDKAIPIAGWKLPAFFCATAGIFIYWRKKDVIAVQTNAFITMRSFSLLWCGFVIAVPFAQLVGHGAFLAQLMGDDYVRDYKRVIEELGELLGYLMIFLGSIEAVLQQKESGIAQMLEKKVSSEQKKTAVHPETCLS